MKKPSKPARKAAPKRRKIQRFTPDRQFRPIREDEAKKLKLKFDTSEFLAPKNIKTIGPKTPLAPKLAVTNYKAAKRSRNRAAKKKAELAFHENLRTADGLNRLSNRYVYRHTVPREGGTFRTYWFKPDGWLAARE
jgi:hypothetical protein